MKSKYDKWVSCDKSDDRLLDGWLKYILYCGLLAVNNLSNFLRSSSHSFRLSSSPELERSSTGGGFL